MNLSDIARVAGLTPYPRHCVTSVSDIGAAVASATRGKTYFYSPDTMRYFRCRVLSARELFDGIAIATVCTQAGDPHRVYTVNVHDLTGYCLEGEREDYATRAQADKALATFVASLDGAAILRDAIKRARDRALREVKAAREALRRFRGTLA